MQGSEGAIGQAHTGNTPQARTRLFSVAFVIAEIWIVTTFVSALALLAMFSISWLLVYLGRFVPKALAAIYFVAVFAGFFSFTYFLSDIVANLRELVIAQPTLQSGLGVALGASYCYLRTIYALREGSVTLWNFVRYYFFLPTFFIGPIVTPEYFCRQKLRPTWPDVAVGAAMLASGLSRFVLSGIIAQVVTHASGPHMNLAAALQSPFELWCGAALAGVWLYLNFSGMSLVAIGVSRMLGIVIPQNFNNPFRATSLTDFWRRWHITLGDWLRINVFNPTARTLRNFGFNRTSMVVPALATMIVCGLWHEVTPSFLIWGALHGVGLAANSLWSQFSSSRLSEGLRASMPYSLACWFLTQAYVAFSWSFFFPLPPALETSVSYLLSMFMLK